MPKNVVKDIPGEIVELRCRFEQWRGSKEKGRAIPNALWCSAVGLAERYGVYPVSRQLGLSYSSLKDKVSPRCDREERSSHGFVEIPALQSAPINQSNGMEVELCLEDGRRLVLRHADRVFVTQLFEAFWGTAQCCK